MKEPGKREKRRTERSAAAGHLLREDDEREKRVKKDQLVLTSSCSRKGPSEKGREEKEELQKHAGPTFTPPRRGQQERKGGKRGRNRGAHHPVSWHFRRRGEGKEGGGFPVLRIGKTKVYGKGGGKKGRGEKKE